MLICHPPVAANRPLSCKTLGDAAFEAFANEYVEELRCYPLDPRRVQCIGSLFLQKDLILA